MKENKIKETISLIEKEIEKINNKKNKLYFYVIDTKGTPSGTLYYIYDLALQLQEMGYDVRMAHSEKEFIGVGSWMGEKYAMLPHYNTEKDNLNLSASDIIFIPEINANVMVALKGKKVPCRKVAILTNFNYLTDIIRPVGTTWANMDIFDCITPTEALAERVREVFPSTHTYVVRPRISEMFFEGDVTPKPLTINIVAKNPGDVNSVINPFHWKYPQYGFVPCRELKGLPKSELAKAFKTAFMTIWIDTPTDFGYTAVEAMASGNIVLGKVPENMPDWMTDEKGNLNDSGIWFYNNRDVHSRMAAIIETYMEDSIPPFIYDEMKKTVSKYKTDESHKDIMRNIVNGLILGRKEMLRTLIDDFNKNNTEETTTENA